MSLKLCISGTTLLEQINHRWNERNIEKDEICNPFILKIASDFEKTKNDSEWFCDQLIAYARNNTKGSNRLSSISFNNKIASRNIVIHKWNWYDSDNLEDIVITFNNKIEDSLPFDIPILFAKGNQWDGVIPFYDDVELAMQKRSKTTDTYRMACRLSELGFYTGKVLSDGQQGLPTTAITSMQDFMGWPKEPYNPSVHQRLWKELRFSK